MKITLKNAKEIFPHKIGKVCFHDLRSIYANKKNLMSKKEIKKFDRLLGNITDSRTGCHEFLTERYGNKIKLIEFCD